jgi:hypothetical protein
MEHKYDSVTGVKETEVINVSVKNIRPLFKSSSMDFG